MLKVNNLFKTYESKSGKYPAVKDVSLQIKQGEFVSLMGPSGSGKTTILNCISGFLKATSGDVLLNNESILNLDEEEMAEIRQNKLGFVFQEFMLVDGLTVEENIHLPQIIAGKDVNEIEKRTDRLLTTFNISDISKKQPNEISGGQKQRVAIARALSNQPLLLLADEPTGNLDSKSGLTVIETFINAKKAMGATILMVTHDSAAASHSDRVIALKDGIIKKELIRKGTAAEFLDEILGLVKWINGDQDEH